MIREINQHHIQDSITFWLLGYGVLIQGLDAQWQNWGLEMLSLAVATCSALLIPLILSVKLVSIEVIISLMPHAPRVQVVQHLWRNVLPAVPHFQGDLI
jgi:hypothetical protein